MIAKVRSMGLQGIGGYEVLLEVYISNGLPAFDVVGLPDAAVREARERVRAAIKNNGYRFPVSRMTVNLAPADKKKAGTLYDLPMFIGILAADGDIDEPGDDCAFIGELSLSGELRPVYGALPMAIAAARCGVKKLFVPADNAAEAAFADGISVYPVKNVDELLRLMRGEVNIEPAAAPALDTLMEHMPDFSEVKGQENVKRALEIAAAGGHNILIVGPPGAGKSMMAKRLPGILPDMSRGEMIQSTEIYSVAGLTSCEHVLGVFLKHALKLGKQPFRNSLGGLESDIARKAVGHDYINAAQKHGACLDIADKVYPACIVCSLEKLICLVLKLSALGLLNADVE